MPAPLTQVTYWDDTDIHRWENVSGHGTPILAAQRTLNGRGVPGDYLISFSSVIPGVSAVADVDAHTVLNSQDYRSPNYRGPYSVDLHTGNHNTDLVAGWDIQLNPSGGFLSTWQGRIYNGVWEGAQNAGNPLGIILDESSGVNNPGLVTDGTPGIEVYRGRFKIKNISAERLAGVWFELIPWAIYKPTGGKGLFYADNVLDLIEEKADSGFGQKTNPFIVTFANVTGSGPTRRVDVLFDGDVLTEGVLDTDHGGAASSSAALLADGVTKYRVLSAETASGYELGGFEFIVDAGVLNTDSGELYVYGVRWAEITPDNGGAPGPRADGEFTTTALWGREPVRGTETGQPAGEIAESGESVLWFRSVLPVGAAYGKAPHPQGWRIRAGLAGADGL